jgi:two-component system, sensor histidine kinase
MRINLMPARLHPSSGPVPAALPDNEGARLAALRAYHILDTDPEPAFDRLTRMAGVLLKTPICLISLVDETRQWFKARYGLDAKETPRELAFCAHAILSERVFEVPDALHDERFAHNPLVTGAPDIRFYAGAPLIAPDGHRLGTFCVIDREPRQLGDDDRRILQDFAATAVQLIDLRLAGRCALAEIDARKKTETELAEMVQLSLIARNQAEEASAVRALYLAAMAHEMKGPLLSVVGSAGQMVGEAHGPLGHDRYRRFATDIHAHGRLLLDLIDDLMAATPADQGRLEVAPQPIDAQAIARQIMRLVRGFARDRQIALALGSQEWPLVEADPQALKQIMLHLLSTAIRDARPGSCLALSARREKGRLFIAIACDQDKGPTYKAPPLPESCLVPDTASESTPIPGASFLGFSLSQRLVAAHGGALVVNAGDQGQTTIVFDLAIVS